MNPLYQTHFTHSRMSPLLMYSVCLLSIVSERFTSTRMLVLEQVPVRSFCHHCCPRDCRRSLSPPLSRFTPPLSLSLCVCLTVSVCMSAGALPLIDLGASNDDDDQALQRSHPPPAAIKTAAAPPVDSPWDDLISCDGGEQAPAAAPPVRRMSLPPGADAQREEVYELCLRYSEWAALDSGLSQPPSVRDDPHVRANLPELPSTSTVGRSKDRYILPNFR